MTVAMLISSTLIAGITHIFLGSRKSFTLQNSLSRQQENGRYAADTIARDLRKAGFWSGNISTKAVTGTAAPVVPQHNCQSDNNAWGRMIARSIYGINHADSTALGNYACINDDRGHANHDVLVLRYAAPQRADALNYDEKQTIEQSNRLYVRFSPTVSEKSGRLFAGRDATNSANNMIRDQPAAAAEITTELVSRAYYVGPSGRFCNGRSIPSLYRKELNKNGHPVTVEIASGIDNLQFRYGLDTNGDGSVNTYQDAGSNSLNDAPQWDSVVSVHFWLLTRAACPETGYINQNTYAMGDTQYSPADRFRRKLYQSIVKLRNHDKAVATQQLALTE